MLAYHAKCFGCSVCKKPLDGTPFTVDSENAIHCVECFQEKFAPRCAKCSKPIVPEPGKEESLRIIALDRNYHVNCYVCEDCGQKLSSKAEGGGCYPLDGHILCRGCNAKRVLKLTNPTAEN